MIIWILCSLRLPESLSHQLNCLGSLQDVANCGIWQQCHTVMPHSMAAIFTMFCWNVFAKKFLHEKSISLSLKFQHGAVAGAQDTEGRDLMQDCDQSLCSVAFLISFQNFILTFQSGQHFIPTFWCQHFSPYLNWELTLWQSLENFTTLIQLNSLS